MNYNKIYQNLINSQKINQSDRLQYKKEKIEYFENHHIIPKCLGGSNDNSNLILLTYREHYIAHWLLTKIYPKHNKLNYALWRMLNDPQKHHIVKSSRKYQLTKNQYIKNISGSNSPLYGRTNGPLSQETKNKIRLTQLHKNNSMYGKTITDKHKLIISIANSGKKLSKETKQKMSISKQGKNNYLFGCDPWELPIVFKSNTLTHTWLIIDEIYKIWITNNKPGNCKLTRLVLKNISSYSGSSLNNVIAFFKSKGNPIYYNKYLDFKNLHI